MRVLASLVGVLPVLALTACQRSPTAQPADIQYGRATCTECQATIADPRFAAQYVSRDGAAKTFDDAGCLMRALRREGDAPRDVYFHDHDSDAWLRADQAWLARTPKTRSPRGYGWAAYASFAAAQNAVTSAGSGEILRYAEAKQRIAQP